MTDDKSARWAQLRRILEQSESEGMWEELCAFLDAWPEAEGLHEVLTYADERLTYWSHDRFAPWEWKRTILTRPNPRLRLVRSFSADGIQLGGIGDEGATAIAGSPYLANVTELDLDHSAISVSGMVALTRSPYLTKLARLNLQRNPLGPEGIMALAQSPNMAGLVFLSLTQTCAGNAGVRALAASPYLRQLSALHLAANDLSEEGVEALASSAILSTIRRLELRDNAVGDTGSTTLSLSPHTQNLRTLSLQNADVEDAGVYMLVTQLPSLIALDLQCNKLTRISEIVLRDHGFERDQQAWVKPGQPT